jgi:hypothetical protein
VSLLDTFNAAIGSSAITLGTRVLGVVGAVGSALSIPVLSVIGGITVQTTIDEDYEDSLEITEHPVEVGAAVTDHSFKRPMNVLLRCGWSNASISSTLGAVASSQFTGGAMLASDFVSGIYSQLLALQETRQPFILSTGLRTYVSMLLENIRVRRDQETANILAVEAEFHQLILASTQSATLPPQQNQANPAGTAEQRNAGTVSPLISVLPPQAGGALPPLQWTTTQ